MREGRSAFLKKSAQKTFFNLGRGRFSGTGSEESKVFWFPRRVAFFSKKKLSLGFTA
jgi:hypothetical protein